MLRFLPTLYLMTSVVCFGQPNVQANKLEDATITVTLLGTGGPQPASTPMDRFGQVKIKL